MSHRVQMLYYLLMELQILSRACVLLFCWNSVSYTVHSVQHCTNNVFMLQHWSIHPLHPSVNPASPHTKSLLVEPSPLILLVSQLFSSHQIPTATWNLKLL